jgi:hypothetical protein
VAVAFASSSKSPGISMEMAGAIVPMALGSQ